MTNAKPRLAAIRIALIGLGTFALMFVSDIGLIKEASAAKDALFAAIDGAIAMVIAAVIAFRDHWRSLTEGDSNAPTS